MVTHRHPLINDAFQLGERYLLWNELLIISDLHLGKTMHFRKAGMPIPSAARDKDYARIIAILDRHKPTKTIVIGDLFHSNSNMEVEEFSMITSTFSCVDFKLVIGNHDVLDASVYRSLDIEVAREIVIENLVMTHEPLENLNQGMVNIFGHFHPGVGLKGKGKQRLTVPCFHFTRNTICLPAFGSLTGLAKITSQKGDRIFAVVNEEVIEVT